MNAVRSLPRNAVCNLPRNAVGEMMPVLLATTMAMPDSRKGMVKSTSFSLSRLIYSTKRDITI